MNPRSNVEWLQWAKTDPLFGIATVPGREREGNKPWTLPEFYESGAAHWANYREEWQRYGVSFDSCLDLGCGAGRMTKHIASDFAHAYGLDISSDMVEIAKKNVLNATFLLSDGATIPLPDNSVSAVFSVQVFQHFDNRDTALDYFREIHRVLAPGGTCLIQIPLIILPFRRVWPFMARIQEGLWRVTDDWVSLKATIKRWMIVHRNRRPFYRLVQYDPTWLFDHLTTMGFRDIHISILNATKIPGEQEPHLVAKK